MSGVCDLFRRYAVASLAAGLGLLAIAALFTLVRARDAERVRADFAHDAERTGAAVERALADGMDVFDALRDLYASTNVSHDEFRHFVRRPMATNRAVRTAMWAPRVTHVERSAWERTMTDGHGITQFDAHRRAVSAEAREEYAPIAHREPKGARPIGFDLASEPALRDALARAVVSESGVAFVEERRLERDDVETLLLLMPVYRGRFRVGDSAGRDGALAGYVVGRLSVRDVLDAAVGDDEGAVLRVTLRTGGAVGAAATLARKKAVSFAGETWSLEIAAGPQYAATRVASRSWAVLLGGLAVVTGLVGVVAAETARRRSLSSANRRLEDEVEERRRTELAARRLAALGAELVATLDPTDVGRRLVAAIGDLCGARAVLYRIDADTAQLVCMAAADPSMLGPTAPIAEALLHRALAERGFVVEHDAASVWAALPLVAHGAPLGALLLTAAPDRSLCADDAALLVGVADQAALALANALNQRRATERAEKLAALSALVQLVTSTMSSHTVFNAIAKAAVTLLGADIARVWVADHAARVLRVGGRFGIAPAVERGLTDHVEIPFGEGLVGRVYESGAPLYVSDLPGSTVLLNRRLVTVAGLRAMAGVPLVTAGVVVGALAIGSRKPHGFTDEEKELMRLLASQAAIAIDNTRLLEVADKRRRDAEDLAEFGRSLSRFLHRDAVAQVTAERLRAVLAARTATVYTRGSETAPAPIAACGRLDSTEADEAVGRYAAHVASAALRLEGPVVVTDLVGDDRIDADPDLSRRAARAVGIVLAMPLSTQETIVAALAVTDDPGRRFSDEEIAMAQAYADRAALALYNARLYEESQTQLRRAEALAAVGQAVSELRDETEIVRRATRALVRLLDADMGAMWTLAPEGDRLLPMAGYRLSEETVDAPFALSRDPGAELLEEIRGQERACGWDDSQAVDRFRDQPWSQVIGHRSLMLVPLRLGERLVGAISLAWTGRMHHFTAEEIELADTVGTQIALSIDNFRLVEQLRARQGRLETLLGISRQLSVMQPTESLLHRIAEACGHLLGAGAVGFRIVDGDALVTLGAYGDAPSAMSIARLPIGQSLSGIVAATGEPLIANDLQNDPRLVEAHRAGSVRHGYTAFLGVPVKLGDRLLGVLGVRARRPSGFNEDDLAIATAFASQAAAALENARLYQEAQQAYDKMVAAQEQLVAAQKMEAVGRLAGGIAHDFNNLLTVITGRAHLILMDTAPEASGRRHAELIESTAKRATSLVTQLLAFSRRQVLQPKLLPLNTIVGPLGTMLRPLIGEQNELAVTLAPGLPCVKVDPTQVEQVVVNLIVNARDALPRGGRIELSTAVETRHAASAPPSEVPDGTWVRLAVTDNGTGMDAATKAHIFEPFFTTKEQGKGTGLGLATVYGIVKQSGGHIDVQSAPGQGTTIAVYLPAAAAPPEDAAEAREAPARGGSETILLAEDEEPVRELLRELLEARGYAVIAARDGLDGLRIWQERGAAVDMILTDVVMPHLSGPEFVRRVTERRPGLPVLYLSGYNELPVEDAAALRSSGRLLEKPFSTHVIAAKVRAVLDARPMAASA